MNERVMQFRIGMFVIVAGLVLIMMIIWFGESPSILRDQVFVKVHYAEAPGVGDGIPVRRSGIKIGEVTRVEFDDAPGRPEGVIVTLALERKTKLKLGTIPRISRALIGDVTIDMIPGKSDENQPTGDSAKDAPMIEGDLSFDPSKALSTATSTLAAIEDAAKRLSTVAQRAEKIDEFIATWTDTGKNLGAAGGRIGDLLKSNESDIKPAITSLRATIDRLNGALDDKTIADFKAGLRSFNAASSKLDAGLADLRPLLTDLGASVNVTPLTNFGQTIWRANRIASEINLLTRALSDGKGGLNPQGSIQQLFLSTALYDNWNKLSVTATALVESAKPAVTSFKVFAERLRSDPAVLSRGAFQR